MKLRLCVSGRLRQGPELQLVNDYLFRSRKIFKLINFSSIEIIEYDGLKWEKNVETLTCPRSSSLRIRKVLLDERGVILSSREFTEILRDSRDDGISQLIFFIGGAQGVPDSLRENFDQFVSFGNMVWPHFLARVMLMEQIYRASTILAGLPYHKD